MKKEAMNTVYWQIFYDIYNLLQVQEKNINNKINKQKPLILWRIFTKEFKDDNKLTYEELYKRIINQTVNIDNKYVITILFEHNKTTENLIYYFKKEEKALKKNNIKNYLEKLSYLEKVSNFYKQYLENKPNPYLYIQKVYSTKEWIEWNEWFRDWFINLLIETLKEYQVFFQENNKPIIRKLLTNDILQNIQKQVEVQKTEFEKILETYNSIFERALTKRQISLRNEDWKIVKIRKLDKIIDYLSSIIVELEQEENKQIIEEKKQEILNIVNYLLEKYKKNKFNIKVELWNNEFLYIKSNAKINDLKIKEAIKDKTWKIKYKDKFIIDTKEVLYQLESDTLWNFVWIDSDIIKKVYNGITIKSGKLHKTLKDEQVKIQDFLSITDYLSYYSIKTDDSTTTTIESILNKLKQIFNEKDIEKIFLIFRINSIINIYKDLFEIAEKNVLNFSDVVKNNKANISWKEDYLKAQA